MWCTVCKRLGGKTAALSCEKGYFLETRRLGRNTAARLTHLSSPIAVPLAGKIAPDYCLGPPQAGLHYPVPARKGGGAVNAVLDIRYSMRQRSDWWFANSCRERELTVQVLVVDMTVVRGGEPSLKTRHAARDRIPSREILSVSPLRMN